MFYVYFIQVDKKKRQPVKIGYSSNPQQRLKELQTANAYKLKVSLQLPFDTEDAAREMEGTMHYLAGRKHRRLMGEWFYINEPCKNFVSKSFTIFDNNQEIKKREKNLYDINNFKVKIMSDDEIVLCSLRRGSNGR